jgi:hypothetical protein
VIQIAGFADKEAKVGALCGEGAGHMVANESGGACEKNLHRKNVAKSQSKCSKQVADRRRARAPEAANSIETKGPEGAGAMVLAPALGGCSTARPIG